MTNLKAVVSPILRTPRFTNMTQVLIVVRPGLSVGNRIPKHVLTVRVTVGGVKMNLTSAVSLVTNLFPLLKVWWSQVKGLLVRGTTAASLAKSKTK